MRRLVLFKEKRGSSVTITLITMTLVYFRWRGRQCERASRDLVEASRRLFPRQLKNVEESKRLTGLQHSRLRTEQSEKFVVRFSY